MGKWAIPTAIEGELQVFKTGSSHPKLVREARLIKAHGYPI